MLLAFVWWEVEVEVFHHSGNLLGISNVVSHGNALVVLIPSIRMLFGGLEMQ